MKIKTDENEWIREGRQMMKINVVKEKLHNAAVIIRRTDNEREWKRIVKAE